MCWDLGWQKSLRKIWTKYFDECHGVVFIVDGADENRFDEVKQEIDSLYSHKDINLKKSSLISEEPKISSDDLESANQEQEWE